MGLAGGPPTLLRQSSAFTQTPASSASVAQKGRIDVHYHIGGQGGLGGGGGANARPTRTSQWTPARAIEDMDRVGTAVGIISASAAGAGTGSIEDRNRQAREFNEL